MHTRIITTEQELIAIKGGWDNLVRSNPETDMPFFSWEWFYRSYLHFGKPEEKELFVVATEDNGQLCGLLPLVHGTQKASKIAYKVLKFCNTGMLPRNTHYSALNLDQESVFRSSWNHLFENRVAWDMIEFANVPETSPFHRFILEDHHQAKCAMIQNQGLTSPLLSFSDSVENYLASLDKKVRYNIKRYVKLFETNEKQHEVRFFQQPPDVEEALRLASEIKKASWKGEGEDSAFFRFFQDILPELFSKHEALVQVIFLEHVPIAASFRLSRNGVFYGFGTDYKQEYKEHSPGVLMLYYLWHHMIEQGGHTFDFCGGDYHYKKQYTDVAQNHSTFQIFHSGMKSRLIYWAKTVLLPFYRKILRKPQPDDFIMCQSEL